MTKTLYPYRKRFLFSNLAMGVLWLLWGIGQVWFGDKPNWIDYGWFAVSGTYLVTFLYMWHYRYMTLEDGVLRINGPFGKTVRLSEVTQIIKR